MPLSALEEPTSRGIELKALLFERSDTGAFEKLRCYFVLEQRMIGIGFTKGGSQLANVFDANLAFDALSEQLTFQVLGEACPVTDCTVSIGTRGPCTSHPCSETSLIITTHKSSECSTLLDISTPRKPTQRLNIQLRHGDPKCHFVRRVNVTHLPPSTHSLSARQHRQRMCTPAQRDHVVIGVHFAHK